MLHDDVQVFVSRMDGLTAFLDEGEAPNEKQFGKVLKWVEELRVALREAPRTPVANPGVAVTASTEPAGGAHTTQWWKDQVKNHLMDNEVLSLDPETADDTLTRIAIDLNADPKEVALRAVQSMN